MIDLDHRLSARLQAIDIKGLCLGYVPALAYGSCRVSDQGTTLRASDIHNARVTILNPFNIHTCLLLLISMLWHRQAIFESKGDKLSSSAECRIRTHRGLRHQIASRLNARWQTDSIYIYMKVNQYLYIYISIYICIYIIYILYIYTYTLSLCLSLSPSPSPTPSLLPFWLDEHFTCFYEKS